MRDRGPLAAAQLTDPRRRDGEWWDRRSFGRQALEYLFTQGELAGVAHPGFERVYDLPERVIPDAVLAQPTPPVDEAQRRLLVSPPGRSVSATVRDLAGYYVIKPRSRRHSVAELVEAGELVEVAVEGWREAGYALPEPGVRSDRPRTRHAAVAVRLAHLGAQPRAAHVRLRLPHRGLRP